MASAPIATAPWNFQSKRGKSSRALFLRENDEVGCKNVIFLYDVIILACGALALAPAGLLPSSATT